MATCSVVIAIIFVLLTCIAIIISFATPNWVSFEEDNSRLCDCIGCDCGMWLSCTGNFRSDGSTENCRWFFSNDFEIERKLPVWFKTVQGLMSGAVATSLLSLIVGLFSLCCYCKRCKPLQAAAAFVCLTFLLITAAVCVFGAKGHLDYNMTIVPSDVPGVPEAVLSWSFWMAVGSGCMALLTTALFFCVDRSDEEYI